MRDASARLNDTWVLLLMLIPMFSKVPENLSKISLKSKSQMLGIDYEALEVKKPPKINKQNSRLNAHDETTLMCIPFPKNP